MAAEPRRACPPGSGARLRTKHDLREPPGMGVRMLTLYAFSAENWNRPKEEVGGLMSLLELYLKKELSTFVRDKVRLKTIRRIHGYACRRATPHLAHGGETRRDSPSTRWSSRSTTARAPRLVDAAHSLRRRRGRRTNTASDTVVGDLLQVPLFGRHARPRSGDPHLRGDPHQQLPPPAVGLRRVPLHSGPLARFLKKADLAAALADYSAPRNAATG